MKREVRVFAPATVGNVGPGFDCLGLCLDALGDTITVTESPTGHDQMVIEGRDADEVPVDFDKNVAGIVAAKVRAFAGEDVPLLVHLSRGLPLCGGLGASAAASVGAALAAQHYFKVSAAEDQLVSWALAGEEAAAGRHLDNIAPCLFGGLTISFFDGQTPVIRSFSVKNTLWMALITPRIRVATRDARAVLSKQVSADVYCRGLANAVGVALALSHGDTDLLSYCLDDPYAEPARAPLIPHFVRAKELALEQGALGFSLSGSGPTVFAACDRLEVASRVCEAVADLYLDVGCGTHVVQVANRGASVLES